MLSFQRGYDGLLHVSSNFLSDDIVPGSPPVSSGPSSAVYDPSSRKVFTAVSSDGAAWVAEGRITDSGISWFWSNPTSTFSTPAVAVACNRLYVAINPSFVPSVTWRPIAEAAWADLTGLPSVALKSPALATNRDQTVAAAYVDVSGQVRYSQASCDDMASWRNSSAPFYTNADRVSLSGYGNVFAEGMLGPSNIPYLRIQGLDATGYPVAITTERVETDTGTVALIEPPTVFQFRGMLFLAGRDGSSALRYWVRNPNTLGTLGSEPMYTGGRIVGGWGVGATPPAFAAVGRGSRFDWVAWQGNVPEELYAATRGIGDGQLWALNMGRFGALDLMQGYYGIRIDMSVFSGGVEPRFINNLPEHLQAMLSSPSWTWRYQAHSPGCSQYLRIAMDTTGREIGYTFGGCVDSPPRATRPAMTLNATDDGAANHWQEWGHTVQEMTPNFKNATYQSIFGNLNPRFCYQPNDCGGGACVPASTVGYYVSQRVGPTTLVCVNHTGPGQRLQGFFLDYEVTSDEHAFLEIAALYRWFGDDLGDIMWEDIGAGDFRLWNKFVYIRDNFYHGVAFNGSQNRPVGDESLGWYGFPLR